MQFTKSLPIRISLTLVVAFFCLPSFSFAQFGLNQERISESEWSRGFHGFNMIAEGNGLERINFEQFLSSNPEDVLIVVFGDLNSLPLNVTNHVAYGGAAMLASDDSTPRDVTFAGFRFDKLVSYPTNYADTFSGMHDCPVVSDFKTHPIVSGIGKIATNQPGYILAKRRTAIASLPRNYRRNSAGHFIAASEDRSGGRVVAIGDQSIFTNQMIIYHDNALFTNQAIKWLKNGQPKKMLVLVNGAEYSTLAPSDVAIDIPPPSQEEVLDAIQNLPPSAMLEFANSVATVVEDENMVNDLIHDTVDQLPEHVLPRFYIFLMFGMACLSFVVAFLYQRKLQSNTASEFAFKKSRNEQTELKVLQSHERQRAAHMLLDRFCMDLANRRFSNWPSFPTGLNVDNDKQSEKLFKSMTQMSVLYKSKPMSFWTRNKLAQLEKQVDVWRTYFEGRPAVVDTEMVQNHWSNQTLEEQIDN